MCCDPTLVPRSATAVLYFPSALFVSVRLVCVIPRNLTIAHTTAVHPANEKIFEKQIIETVNPTGAKSAAKVSANGAERAHPGLRRAKPVRGRLPSAQAHLPRLPILQVPLLWVHIPADGKRQRVRHMRAQQSGRGNTRTRHNQLDLGRRKALDEQRYPHPPIPGATVFCIPGPLSKQNRE